MQPGPEKEPHLGGEREVSLGKTAHLGGKRGAFVRQNGAFGRRKRGLVRQNGAFARQRGVLGGGGGKKGRMNAGAPKKDGAYYIVWRLQPPRKVEKI